MYKGNKLWSAHIGDSPMLVGSLSDSSAQQVFFKTREHKKKNNNNDGTHATFAKFLQSFRKFFEVFVGLETCLDLFGPSRMRSDTFGCARKHLEAFGRFRKFFSKISENV